MSGLSIKELTRDLPEGYTYVRKYANNTIVCRNKNGELVYRHFHTDIVVYNPQTDTVKLYLGNFGWSPTTRKRVRWIVYEHLKIHVGIYPSRRKNMQFQIYVYQTNKGRDFVFREGFTLRKEINRYPELNEYEILYRKRKLVKVKKW